MSPIRNALSLISTPDTSSSGPGRSAPCRLRSACCQAVTRRLPKPKQGSYTRSPGCGCAKAAISRAMLVGVWLSQAPIVSRTMRATLEDDVDASALLRGAKTPRHRCIRRARGVRSVIHAATMMPATTTYAQTSGLIGGTIGLSLEPPGPAGDRFLDKGLGGSALAGGVIAGISVSSKVAVGFEATFARGFTDQQTAERLDARYERTHRDAIVSGVVRYRFTNRLVGLVGGSVVRSATSEIRTEASLSRHRFASIGSTRTKATSRSALASDTSLHALGSTWRYSSDLAGPAERRRRGTRRSLAGRSEETFHIATNRAVVARNDRAVRRPPVPPVRQ